MASNLPAPKSYYPDASSATVGVDTRTPEQKIQDLVLKRRLLASQGQALPSPLAYYPDSGKATVGFRKTP